MPYLCRLERSKIERGAHVGHAWNTIKFYGDVDQEGQQKSYTVDLMHQVGTKKVFSPECVLSKMCYTVDLVHQVGTKKRKKGGKRGNALGWHGLRQWHRIKP